MKECTARLVVTLTLQESIIACCDELPIAFKLFILSYRICAVLSPILGMQLNDAIEASSVFFRLSRVMLLLADSRALAAVRFIVPKLDSLMTSDVHSFVVAAVNI